MAGIPLSALRRALAEMADMSASAPMRRSAPAAFENLVGGSVGMAPIGAGVGLLANMPDETRGESLDQYGNRLMGGIATGAGIGGALGAGAVLLGGARGLRMGLREALAEQAATRGMGRRAVRETADGEDAARFATSVRPQDAESIAAEIRQMATQPGEVEALVRQVIERDPVMGQKVMRILMGEAPY